MMTRLAVAIFSFAVIGHAAAIDIKECPAIIKDSDRLACFDAVFPRSKIISPPVAAALPPDLAQQAERLVKARTLLARMIESNRPKSIQEWSKQPLVTKDEYYDAITDLELVANGGDPKNAADATKLLAALLKAETDGAKAAQAAVNKELAENVEGRKQYALDYEQNALSNGLSVTVTTSGPKATIFNLRYPALSKALIFQLTNNADFQQNLRRHGFTKATVSNGYQWIYTVDLSSR